MALLFRIAFLNLWRRVSRSVLVIMMVTMSITGLILIQGIFQGMLNQMIDNSLRSDTGHVSIYHPDYRTNKALAEQIDAPQTLIDIIKAQPHVTSVIDRVRGEGLVATAKHSQGTVLLGTSLEEENRHANLQNYLIEGEYSFGTKARGAIIGADLAEKLKVTVGKKIIITAQDMHKEINGLNLKVMGIVRTNNIEIDKSGVIMDKGALRTLLGLGDQSTQIAIMVDTRANQEPLVATLQEKLSSHNVMVGHWTKLFIMFDQIEQMQVAFSAISYGLVFIIAALGIFGVILVSVLERVREFGIMLAIGSTFNRVRWQIIAESVFLGLIGLFFGSLLGGALLYYFTTVGIDLSNFSDAMAMFGMDAIIRSEFHISYFIYAGVAVVLATFFAALWPIRVLQKLNPIQAVNA
ncbi:MAG: hypothetical protein KU37_09120 [Sulfuricurvum sp. PC08-66]|nr:MAG: hypothetical protein KU37_09120 [Sulfuricurvum sp. PC08-66]